MFQNFWTCLPLAVTAAGLLISAPAHAGLDACNKTAEDIYVAVAHNSDQGWISLGWWMINPKSCVTMVGGNLQYRYYYVYAESETQTWGGNHNFCIQDAKFDIVGGDNCEARGYETVGFFEHDIGGNTDYTVLITP